MTEFSETSKQALAIIKKHKKGVVISELAKTIGVAKSNFGSRHLKPLEEAGLVKRFKIGKDFYVKRVKKAKMEEVIEELEKPVKPEEPAIKEVVKKPKELKKIEVKEAKNGFIAKKYEKWKSAQQFEKIPLKWFQNRPIEAKRYLRYLINISVSGGHQRTVKINKAYGGVNNFRAIIDTLIDFL